MGASQEHRSSGRVKWRATGYELVIPVPFAPRRTRVDASPDEPSADAVVPLLVRAALSCGLRSSAMSPSIVPAGVRGLRRCAAAGVHETKPPLELLAFRPMGTQD